MGKKHASVTMGVRRTHTKIVNSIMRYIKDAFLAAAAPQQWWTAGRQHHEAREVQLRFVGHWRSAPDERKFWLRDHFRAIFIPATWFRRLILTICSRKWFNLTKFTRYQNLLCSAPLSEIPKKVWILSIREEYNFMLFYILIINCLYMYFGVF